MAAPAIAAVRRRSSRLPAQPPQESAPIGEPEGERQKCESDQTRSDQRRERTSANERRSGECRAEDNPQQRQHDPHA
jgi:hypothetical protein